MKQRSKNFPICKKYGTFICDFIKDKIKWWAIWVFGKVGFFLPERTMPFVYIDVRDFRIFIYFFTLIKVYFWNIHQFSVRDYNNIWPRT